jgi:glycosyltransferase involved in cell wall biosynthesis
MMQVDPTAAYRRPVKRQVYKCNSRGAEVNLFTPKFEAYYPRGQVKTAMPYPITSIPFNRYTYNYASVIKRFRHCVENFQPDLVIIGDGYHMKNHLMSALGPQRCFLRFYAYEMLCINLHYYRYHEGKVCDQGYFENPRECHRCWFKRMPAIGRAAQIAVGWPERHPNLHFSQEYIGSLAFTEGYRQKMMENFSQLAGAIVYNPFMRGKLEPYINDIHMVPSGVDPERFTPPDVKPQNSTVKIFLPGRANDPLKGLDVLIGACDLLQKEGLSFEVHYTAAMDCPAERPWLKNRGWTGPDELPKLYHEMDIVTVPSTWIEPFGITALEGMASGLPVVASNAGGLAETIVDNQTGKHFQPGSAKNLADALRPLLKYAELRTELGQQGRERVLQHYAWDRILDDRYVPIIEDYLETNRRTQST